MADFLHYCRCVRITPQMWETESSPSCITQIPGPFPGGKYINRSEPKRPRILPGLQHKRILFGRSSGELKSISSRASDQAGCLPPMESSARQHLLVFLMPHGWDRVLKIVVSLRQEVGKETSQITGRGSTSYTEGARFKPQHLQLEGSGIDRMEKRPEIL